MSPRARSVAGCSGEREAAVPSRADHDEQLTSGVVGPAGARCWVCGLPVADLATDYDLGGPHDRCGWKAEQIERGLAGPPPPTSWADVRW